MWHQGACDEATAERFCDASVFTHVKSTFQTVQEADSNHLTVEARKNEQWITTDRGTALVDREIDY